MKNRTKICLALFILAAPAAAADTIIMVPEGSISTVHSSVHLVGSSDAGRLLLLLNGDPVDTLATREAMFHTHLSLPYGLNQVQIVPLGPAGGEGPLPAPDDSSGAAPADTVSIEVLCGPRISRVYQKAYLPHEFHNSRGRDACLACHDLDALSDETAEDATWCYSCHPDIRDRFERHGTGDKRVCTNCHRINPDLTHQKTGVYTDMNPCYLCHKDKIGEFAQDYIHGPVAGGTCTVCHDPHGTEFEKNLHSPVPVLCLFCHTSIEETKEPVKHKPFERGRCTSCHDPHATGNRWVLTVSSGELCLKCHPGVVENDNHRHPVGAKPRNRLVAGLNLNDRGRIECLTCHEPHAGRAAHLLRGEGQDSCLGCHPEYR